jgi:hypothetical protein
MSPLIPYAIGLVTIIPAHEAEPAPAKSRLASGTEDWTLSEDDPDIATVTCNWCKRTLHFSPVVTRASIEVEMAAHRKAYCRPWGGESVR